MLRKPGANVLRLILHPSSWLWQGISITRINVLSSDLRPSCIMMRPGARVCSSQAYKDTATRLRELVRQASLATTMAYYEDVPTA